MSLIDWMTVALLSAAGALAVTRLLVARRLADKALAGDLFGSSPRA